MMLERISIFQGPASRGILLAGLLGCGGHLSAQVPEGGDDIRGAKPPVTIPVEKRTPAAVWIGAAGVVFLAGMAGWLWGRHAMKKHLRTPREVAFSALLKLEKDPDSISAEVFANRAAHVVREYVAARFGLAAPRRTTEEFLGGLSKDESSPLAGERDHLKAFLKACDMAKFAGAGLDSAQRMELLQAARSFVTVAVPPVSRETGGKS